MSPQFADNPAYVECERLLRELHRVIAQGSVDSPEADAIRDAMEEPEKRLNGAEIARLNGLSADLYMLSGEEVLEPSLPHIATVEELRRQIDECKGRGDWEGILQLLRRRPSNTPLRAVALNRARAYDALGHYETALVFFEHLLSLSAGDPTDPALQSLHLMLLENATATERARNAAKDYAAASPGSAVVLVSAAGVLFSTSVAKTPEELRSVLRLISNALEQVTPVNPIPISSAVFAYAIAAECLRRLGLNQEAVAALDQALGLSPSDREIADARDSLITGQSNGVEDKFLTWARQGCSRVLFDPTERNISSTPPVWNRAA